MKDDMGLALTSINGVIPCTSLCTAKKLQLSTFNIVLLVLNVFKRYFSIVRGTSVHVQTPKDRQSKVTYN